MSEANVGSIDAVREFRTALNIFLHEARDSLITYDLEARRALEWLLEYAPKMWQQEIRKTTDRVTELNIAWQACRAQKLPGGGQPACLEEKKALDKARAHLAYCQEKYQKTKKWGAAAERQAIEYKGRSTQLMSVLDGDLPNSIALLDRVLTSLESYVKLQHQGGHRDTDQTSSQASVAQPPGEKDAKAEASPAAAGGQAGPASAGGQATPAQPAAGADQTTAANGAGSDATAAPQTGADGQPSAAGEPAHAAAGQGGETAS